MVSLYPPIEPYARHTLAVDPPHQLYLEESGNPQGLAVVFLHGGPGAGTDPDCRRFFDPNHYRIIVWDQRGAGRSTPHACLEKNTTLDLVNDLETIRQYLGIEQWVIFGGSWGSTLGLVYAENHPERVLHLILRGIFLCRPEEFKWFYEPGGASRVFPDAWQEYEKVLSAHERKNMMQSYYQRLISEDEKTRIEAAHAWSKWEGSTATLLPNENVVAKFTEPHVALSLARIEAHYFVNDIFLSPNYILQNASRLAKIPGTIVHGRYDMCCPFDNAYLLHQVWPQAKLVVVPDGGHSAKEPGVLHALITATQQAYQRLR